MTHEQLMAKRTVLITELKTLQKRSAAVQNELSKLSEQCKHPSIGYRNGLFCKYCGKKLL